jgi:hypothetical protein
MLFILPETASNILQICETYSLIWSEPPHWIDNTTFRAGSAKQFSYEAAAGSKNWDDAQAFCQSKGNGWSLASITSKEEHDYVWSLVNTNIWIGLAVPSGQRSGDPYSQVSAQHSEKFVWADGSVSSFRNWDHTYLIGQPDNDHSQGATEYCTQMWSLVGGAWNDATCSNPAPFVCSLQPSGGILEYEDTDNESRCKSYIICNAPLFSKSMTLLCIITSSSNHVFQYSTTGILGD